MLFDLFYFHWSYYNKYFVRYLQIKSSLVLITNYSIINACYCVKDTTLTNQRFVCLFYFHWSYYNKYIVRYLQIKSSLVLIEIPLHCLIWHQRKLLSIVTNYSIVNARNCVKDTTLTTQLFFFVRLFYFHWSYYNKYLVRYLRIKSSLVLMTNYSII